MRHNTTNSVLVAFATIALTSTITFADDRGRGRDHAARSERSASTGAPAPSHAEQAPPRPAAAPPREIRRAEIVAAPLETRRTEVIHPPAVSRGAAPAPPSGSQGTAVAPRAVPRNEVATAPRVDRPGVATPRAIHPDPGPQYGGPRLAERPHYGPRSYYGRPGYVRPYYGRPYYGSPYYRRPYYSRPYYPRPYVFRPHWQLGFGIYVGYPFAYTYAYPVPVPVYGYGAPVEPVVVGPGSSYYGGVSLEFTPGDAAVFVDGNYAGIVEDFDGTRQPLNLAAGTHRVELQAPDYEPLTFDVTVQPGQVVPYRGDMLAAR